jgi:hypothetical protein
LSATTGRTDAAAPRVSWGSRRRNGLRRTLTGLTAASATMLSLAAPAAHANVYTVRAEAPGVPTSYGWSGWVNSNGNNFVSVWDDGNRLVGQFAPERTRLHPW